jgi:hypothetical protein
MADRSGFQPFFEATAFQAVVVHLANLESSWVVGIRHWALGARSLSSAECAEENQSQWLWIAADC